MSADLTGQLLGHYLVQEVIGRGGMSVVYRGVDQRLQRSVALKVMSEQLSADPEFRTRFLEEARAASAIDHVNVVPLYDFGETAGALFIAMRLVDGTDLARELATGPMPVRRVLALLGQVGAALDMLHERGLVHLDVKPANVLITRNESVGTEHVYLADFGLTRRGSGGHLTAAGDFLGSPSYAAPEHLRAADIGPASDEYSMTCMLFAALAGRPPYVGDVRTVVTGHLSGVVPSLSAQTDLPPAVDRVIARGLAADPALRYPNISDLLTAVRRAIADGGDVAPAVGPAPPAIGSEPPATGLAAPVTGPPVAGQQALGPMTGQRAPEPAADRRPAAATAQFPAAAVSRPQAAAAPFPPAAAASLPPEAAASLPSSAAAPRPAPAVARPPAAAGWQPPTPSYVAAGAPPPRPIHPDPRRSPPHPGQLQVRPAQFAGTGQHRPAAHRIEPTRSRWQWWLGLALVAVLAVVVVMVVAHSASSDGMRLSGSSGSTVDTVGNVAPH